MQQLSLAIDGMTCVHCAKRVEVALRRVAGVRRAHVNLSEKIATVDYDPQQTDVTPIANAVREEGFSAGTALLKVIAAETTRWAAWSSGDYYYE